MTNHPLSLSSTNPSVNMMMFSNTLCVLCCCVSEVTLSHGWRERRDRVVCHLLKNAVYLRDDWLLFTEKRIAIIRENNGSWGNFIPGKNFLQKVWAFTNICFVTNEHHHL